MRYELTIHNGIPAWRYGDVVLPVMAGGDGDEDALEALARLLAGGKEGHLRDLMGQTVAHTGTGRSGVLRRRNATTTEKRQGHDFEGSIFYLDYGTGRQFLSGRGGFSLMDGMRNVSIVSSTGTLTSGGKASESDLERLFPGMAGGTGDTYHPPAWRPGEFGLEQQEQRRRDQELQLERESLEASIAQSEADLAWAKEEFAKAQAGEDRRAAEYAQLQMNMLEKRLENSRRELVYSGVMAERGTLIQEKAATGRAIMELGPDPFRQAAILGGGVQRGTTPQQTAVGQGQAFMNQPLPEVSMGMDVSQLEQAIAQMQGQGMTQPQFGGFGMAGGGVIEMEHKDGGFSMKPTTKVSRLIGEGKHGEGLKAGTAEILTIEKGPFSIKSVEVTPLEGGWAYGGLEKSVFQGLSPLYSGFGWDRAPTAKSTGAGFGADPQLFQFGGGTAIYMIDPYTGQRRHIANPDVFHQSGFKLGDVVQRSAGAAGYWDKGPSLESGYGLNPAMLGQMGIDPSLVSFQGSDAVYYRDPATGDLRHIPNKWMFREAGFNMRDVAQMGEGSRGEFDFGSALTAPPPPVSREGAFGSLGSVMIESTTGAILPAVHKIAGQLAQWKAAGDYRYGLAIQAYGNALDPRTGEPLGGISQQYIDSIVGAATPQRGAFGGRRIGFTGGFTG